MAGFIYNFIFPHRAALRGGPSVLGFQFSVSGSRLKLRVGKARIRF